ncbi:hypothetical protein FPRO06_13016 [Fusarium proliferatum]|nr:hypothetical protein FPRO06_13016 [Fusarium proliferatum]CVL11709.1 uncharacterized protein FPRN_14915 [Fusarium proliferatum]
MLSHSRLHQHDSATVDLKTTWLPAVRTKPIPIDSVLSDDDGSPDATIIHHEASSFGPDREHDDSLSRKASYQGVNGTTIFSRRDFSDGLTSNRHVSQAMSVVSKPGTVRNFSMMHHHHENNALYDTTSLWKFDREHVENASLTVELDVHMQRALDRYCGAVGCAFDFKRSVTPKDFLALVTNERLRYMPDKGSRLDCILKRADSFGVKFDKIMSAVDEIPTYEASSLVLSSCKTLIRQGGKHSFAVERFFTLLDEAIGIVLIMSQKLDRGHSHSHRICSIFQSSLAMIIDIVVDVTASFGRSKSGFNERSLVAQFESRFLVIKTRLTQLRAELYLQTLVRWCDGDTCSTESLLLLLQGFESFDLETCPPAYLHILVKACLSLSSHGEHTETLRWYRFLWTSLEKHRHDCDISFEQYFEVYQEYLVVLGLHQQFSERICLAEEFQNLVLAELGCKHLLYLRSRIEFAKILELDSVRYIEAVSIYEELGHFDFHGFDECHREEILALIEITKYRLSLLFESHPEMSHRAEALLIDSFTSLKLRLCYSDEKVIIALTRIIEYHRNHKHGGTSAAIKVLEEYILGLLVEERSETVLFRIAHKMAKLYREISSVEIGIKFIQHVKDQVLGGQHTAIEGHCGFSHGQLAQLDRRSFIFIYAFEQLLCGYERENMLDEIIREVYTETCLYEAWSVAVYQTKRDIHARLAAGARLVAFLDKKGRYGEVRHLRNEIWEIFKTFCPKSIINESESLRQLFELTLANVHKKAVSFDLLETLVEVGLAVFTKTRDYGVSLQLFRWSQIYFSQFTQSEQSKAITLAFRISECLSRRQGGTADHLLLELQTVSLEILIEVVLKADHLNVDFHTLPFAQLNAIICLLGQRKDYAILERILQCLWETRISSDWSSTTIIATGRRLCEVKFATGHQTSALALLESICYNLRDVYGPCHRLTVECETLRASFYNACGNYRGARDIHMHLLEEVNKIDRNDSMHDHEHLSSVMYDQAKRLKWVNDHHQTGDDGKGESFYKSILQKTGSHMNGYNAHNHPEMEESMPFGGEKETKWKLPDDWSLPFNEAS